MKYMKKCSRCGINEKNSTSSWCKECKKQSARAKRLANGIKPREFSEIVDNTKKCTTCKEFKDLYEFSPTLRGLGGLATSCKPCMSKYQLNYSSKEERRANTQRYRDNNREWWRSLHRINQFNRTNRVKLASDGSVTKEFAISIYNNDTCYYCNNITEGKNRTLEHKLPLIRGGLHSSSNIVMACRTCNNTKRQMTEEEYKQYKYAN